jgi:WD40 repeat protein
MVSRSFANHTSQLSSICLRPASTVPLFPALSPPKTEFAPSFNYDRRRSSLGSNNDLESLFGDESPNGHLNNSLMDPVIETDQSISSQEPMVEEQSPGKQMCTDVFLTSSIDGAISLWDRRQDRMVARLGAWSKGTPPWCMSVLSLPSSFLITGMLVHRWRIHLCW